MVNFTQTSVLKKKRNFNCEENGFSKEECFTSIFQQAFFISNYSGIAFLILLLLSLFSGFAVHTQQKVILN